MPRRELLESIATTIADYRAGEIATPTAEHVERWVNQFDEPVQDRILYEMDYVLKRTYLSKITITEFLNKIINSEKFAGTAQCEFWKQCNFLRIQIDGSSQNDLLDLINSILLTQCKFSISECESTNGPFIYIDDFVFSGMRVGNDLERWINECPLDTIKIYALVVGTHSLGERQSKKRIVDLGQKLNKHIEFNYKKFVVLENELSKKDYSDVLWPTEIPNDKELHEYMEKEKKFPFISRNSGGKSKHDIFSSEEGRQLLEKEMLLAGMRILSKCKEQKRNIRPLGYSYFGLGFGSMLATYRNCPNNCPLALWWGDPTAPASSPLSWYPLLPRKTYSDADVDFNLLDCPF